ncbi:MAG: hypothetical protein AAF962_27575 [Actinomycetota bacterium]
MLRTCGAIALALTLTACGGADDGGTAADPAEATVDRTATDTATSTTEAATTTEATTPRQLQDAVAAVCESGELSTAPAADDVALLADRDGLAYCVGPALAVGGIESAASNAAPSRNDEVVFAVFPIFTDAGIDAFNAAATPCAVTTADTEVCPTGRLAIVVDDLVISAPAVQQAAFARDQISITGDFTPEEADALAQAMQTSEPTFRPVLADPAPAG